MEFFATCPTGFERLLANELEELEALRVRPLQGRVSFEGSLGDAYRVCLWSHLSSRVLAVLGRSQAHDSNELYEGASSIAWEEQLLEQATFAVDASGSNAQLKTTQFTAMRVKDAIVDRMRARGNTRPAVDAHNPDLCIFVRIAKDKATLGIDLTGTPLFNRMYARGKASKGLRADYAAALLRLTGWPSDEVAGPHTLVALAQFPDPLLIEATLMAANYAPGLSHARWGFTGWTQHDQALWNKLCEEARSCAVQSTNANILYSSFSNKTSQAKVVLRSLGIVASTQPVSNAAPMEDVSRPMLVADLSDLREHEIVREASWLGSLQQTVRSLQVRKAALATRDDLPRTYLRQEPSTSLQSMLGRDKLELQLWEGLESTEELPTVELGQDREVPVLVAASDQFVARLKKNAKARAKWARREDVSCYRLYDADLPDYAVSIDLFQGTDPETGELNGRRWLQLYEYAPPKSVDATLARSRLMDVLAITPALLSVREEDTFLRVRRRGKGGSQYADEARHVQAFTRIPKNGAVPLPAGAHLIDEGGLTFEVNFSGRLDCGIFLDHRDTRSMLREMAKLTKGSKRFLNLFAYTGTATCYAADGGMRYTTTVDLSNPSLDWARRNMARNGFVGKEHEFVQADVVSWIREQRRTKNRWDLVFCDVPTFSNSNRMGRRSFDVQRDHAELLIGVSRLLTRNGVCVFSCNLRTFKPDEAALNKAGVSIEDITQKTIPEDFQRNMRIHHAYLVRRTPQ